MNAFLPLKIKTNWFLKNFLFQCAVFQKWTSPRTRKFTLSFPKNSLQGVVVFLPKNELALQFSKLISTSGHLVLLSCSSSLSSSSHSRTCPKIFHTKQPNGWTIKNTHQGMNRKVFCSISPTDGMRNEWKKRKLKGLESEFKSFS